jgi:hypothetical protein
MSDVFIFQDLANLFVLIFDKVQSVQSNQTFVAIELITSHVV